MGGEGLEIKLETVVSESDIRRKKGFPLGVEGEVGEMGQPGLLGMDIVGHFDGFGDGQVGGVRLVAQSVDDEDRDVTNEIPDVGWHGGAIGQIDGPGAAIPIQAKAGGGNSTMGDGERNKGDGAEGKGALDSVGFGADVGSVAVMEVESVIESLVETGKGVGVGIDGDAISVFNRVGAKVIEAGDVVGVAVGVNNRVEPRNGGAQGLGTKIG